MRNRKVELDTKGSPRSPISNPRFFDGRIGIKHRLAADFVDAGVEMAANIRQHGTFQVLVLEINGTPRVFRPGVGDFIPQRIWIVEAAGRELIERRIGIRRPFLIRWEIQNSFPYANLAMGWN